MKHKQVDATATPTLEKGVAVLLVSAWTKDRGGDVIQRGAFADTIGRGMNRANRFLWHGIMRPANPSS